MDDQGRFEMKFAVPLLMRDQLMRHAVKYMVPDPRARSLAKQLPFADAWGYPVHSLYFDSPGLDDYFERLQERKVRNRLRIRTYGRAGKKSPIFLENKRKLDNRVVKQRVQICNTKKWKKTPGETPWDPWVDKLTGTPHFVGRHFSWLIQSGRREPVSLVHYIREVYVPRALRAGRLRFTLDHQVSVTSTPDITNLQAEPDRFLIPSDWMVMELKYDQFPAQWMLQLCRELKLVAEPISKFGMSVAQTMRSHKPHEVRYLTPRSLRKIRHSPPPPSEAHP